MKLKSKNSFLKRISCIALSLMLCLTSFTLAGFVPTLEAEAATSKTLMHYTFDDSSYSIGSKLSTPDGKSYSFYNWQNGHTVGNGYYYNRDGGFYGNFTALSGKNNWVFTYKGYSENLGNDGDCEIGLGTAEDNTNVIRISSNGKIFVNNEGKAKAQGSLNYSSSATYDSSKVNTIKFEYLKDQMYVTINNNSFGPYTVPTGNSVNSIYTGVNCSNAVTTSLLGTRYHYVDDIVATTVDDTCVTKADFETAFTNFENKISNTKLYTNIKPAYDAYVNARKVYDSYYYGNDITLTNISDALLELEAQTAKLTTEWQSPTGTAVPYFNEGTVQSSAYSNLLYSNKVDDYINFELYQDYAKSNVIHRIANNQTVMLYDGVTSPKMPVVYQVIMKKNDYWAGRKYRYPYTAYPTTASDSNKDLGDLFLTDKWNGSVSNGTATNSSLYNFENIYNQTGNRVGHNSSTINAGAEMSVGYMSDGYSSYFAYANVLQFNNNFTNDTTGTYSKKYNIWWCFGSEDSGKTSLSALRLGTKQANDNAAIYVVNYKPLRDKIVNAKSNIPNNLTNVKQGGLTTYLSHLNDIMAFNPNDYFSNNTSVSVCVNDFNSAMATNMTKASDMENATITTDNSAYDTIRDEIDKYKTIKNDVDNDLKFYKADTLSAYENAYNEAKAVMADVDNNGYKPASNTTPNDKAQALKTARENLKEIFKVTFKDKDRNVVETRDIEPNHPLGELPRNTEPVQNTEAKQHTVYSWPNGVSENTVIQGSGVYYEIAKTESCAGTATPITLTESGHEIKKHKTTCSVCNAEYIENHNLEYDSDNKYAQCKGCVYHTEVDNYTFKGFRITKGNLFDFDEYASKTASTKVVDNKGTSYVDTENDTITVAASGYDVYTNHQGNADCYTIPVIGGNTYTFSYVPSKSDNQVYVFFYNDGNQTATLGESYNYKVISEGKEPDKTGKNTDYFVNNYSAKENSESKIIFTAPANCNHVDFRFGTVQAGSICTFSEISFYECDPDGNPKVYEVLESGVEKNANVLSKLNIPSAVKCNASYDMFNNSDAVREGDTVTTNLNITLDTEHNYQNSYAPTYSLGNSYKDTEDYYTHRRSCSDCQYNDTQSCKFGVLVKNDNTATLTCSVCGGTYTLDLEAYNKAVADANNSINNSAAYTSASRTALSSVLTAQDAALNLAKTQTAVDKCTETIISKNKLEKDGGVLVLEQYNVEFYYVLDNNPAEKCPTGNTTVDYGTEFELTAPSIEGNYSILKWIRKTYPNGKPKEETVGSLNKTLKGRYTGKTEYYVYLKTIPAQQESTETANIYLTDRLGRVIDAMSVNLTEGKATLDVSVIDNSIKIGNVTMTAPSISFYRVSGFRFSMNNEPVTNTRYTITDDTYISVTYTPATSFKITCDSTCKADKTEAQWDDKVTVTANNNATETTQWYVNGVLVGYGPKYVFRANQDVNITCENKSVTLRPTAAVSRLSYSSPIDRTITVVGSFNLPDGYTFVETGVLLKTSAVNNTDDVSNVKNYNLKSGNAKKFVATNYTKDTHQFTVNVYSSKKYDEIYLGAVAYLTYEDANGNENTVYSPLVNTTYSNGKNTQSSISQEVA